MKFEADNTRKPTFETRSLREQLVKFLETPWVPNPGVTARKVGDFKFGAYAFYDFDGEPIYVGQTNERLRTRIRRHLTNQRTDAVAMNVLDPFEVLEIEVWPLPQFEGRSTKDQEANRYLNSLEAAVYRQALRGSRFGAVLNEKPPPACSLVVELPNSFRARVVADEVFAIRAHPDHRIARRAQVISRLAQVIAERKVQDGLRRTLLVQARRLEWLAERRLRLGNPLD